MCGLAHVMDRTSKFVDEFAYHFTLCCAFALGLGLGLGLGLRMQMLLKTKNISRELCDFQGISRNFKEFQGIHTCLGFGHRCY